MTVPLHHAHPSSAADLLTRMQARPLPETSGPCMARAIADPSTGQRRVCYLALRAAGRALAGDDRLRGVTSALDGLRGGKRRSDRARAVLFADEIVRRVPAGSSVLAVDAAAVPVRVPDEHRYLLEDDHPLLLVRLPGGDTVFLETHPATHPGGTWDPWMSGRVARQRLLAADLPGFAGTVVLTPRSLHLAVHASSDGDHRLGECPTCERVT